MFVILDGGIALPVPASVGTDPFYRGADVSDRRWKEGKQERWQRAYTHCLFTMAKFFEAPLHEAVPRMGTNMLDVVDTDPVVLRFFGEMMIAGYVELHERKQKGSKDKTERIIMPTELLLGVGLGDLEPPASAIKYPAVCGKDYLPKGIQVRHGVASRKNKQVASVIRDIADERFTVNEFILGLVREFPPELEGPSSKLMMDRSLHSAELLRGQTFRFHYFLDSRSRMYVATTCGVTPQGADWEKAMLIPVYAEALTPDGALALYEAALGYAEQDWDILTMIGHAREPQRHHAEWSKADKPYSYMSCAHLLARYDENPSQALPAFIPLDGRCSGLQHWSAVTRSQAITRHLGMEEDEDPLDIYERIAAEWRDTLEDDLKHLATRKAAKVPVMTWGYSATRMTSMDHMDKLYGAKSRWCRKEKAFVVYKEGMERGVAGKLGCDLYERLNETLAELTEAVGWVCDAATLIAKEGHADIHWPTPDGFECKQRKLKAELVQVQVTLSDGSDFQVVLGSWKDQIPNPAKHRSAIAPNVIHSLDATHLRMVARKLAGVGLPMIFIHDSFATHVNHRAKLYGFIVEAFADLYSGDWLRELKAYWTERYGIELADPPKQGDWEPSKVLRLEKFFI